MESISFKSGKGNQVFGTLSGPEGADRVVIISHGFTSAGREELMLSWKNPSMGRA